MKKRIVLLIVILLSLFVNVNKVDAVAMWLQCTDEPDGKMEGTDSDYTVYNTFAVINNNLETDGTKHLIYQGNRFYNADKKFGPLMIRYTGKSASSRGQICWIDGAYTKDITACKGDKIDISELYNGYCPVGVIESDVDKTWYPVAGDFLVPYGKQKNKGVEYLNESIFVIYYYKVSGKSETYVMIEGYDSTAGDYGFATNYEKWDDFKKNIGYKDGSQSDDLITVKGFDHEYMDWTMMSQARRIAHLNGNYFKLLDYRDSWMVNSWVSGQKFVVDETRIIYMSDDDTNKGFGKWIQDWYTVNSNNLGVIIETLNKFKEDGVYSNLIETSTEINNKIDDGERYIFNNDLYTPEDMVVDFENAYNDLERILGTDVSFTAYEENCTDTRDNTDAYGALHTSFMCDIFGKVTLEKMAQGKRKKLLDQMISGILAEKIDEISNSDIGIDRYRGVAKDYLVLLANAISYISNNVYFDEEIENKVEDLVLKYRDLLEEKYGTQIVVDCESLFDSKLLEKINYYLDIVKIAIPILLMGLGVMDFTKAVFAGDDDKMRKAQTAFAKRIGISILIFFVPTIVKLLLTLANMVWNFIEPSSCGIFDV